MSNRLLVGTRKGLFVIERGAGGRWGITATSFLGDPAVMVLADSRDGAWHVALDHGHFGSKMHRSRDQGRTWSEMAAPKYPAKPEGETDADPNTKETVPWTLKKVWALEAGLGSQPGLLWCGTLPGGLFRSNDSGETWDLVGSLWHDPKRKEWFGGGAEHPGIHSVCVDPRDGRRVLVGISCGGAWLTEDGGETWACSADGMRADFMPPEGKMNPNIQDPHLIVQSPSSPDCYWTQHHNGIWRSTDGARSWQEVTAAQPSNFGFAVAVHPKDPETAWFVPAIKDEKRYPVDGKVVVSRTRDGGRSFEVLREGLPQEHSYDLTYRHALSIDGTGERLAFGSTTGSLWVSENGGDSWSHIGGHLPPVNVVKFA